MRDGKEQIDFNFMEHMVQQPNNKYEGVTQNNIKQCTKKAP